MAKHASFLAHFLNPPAVEKPLLLLAVCGTKKAISSSTPWQQERQVHKPHITVSGSKDRGEK